LPSENVSRTFTNLDGVAEKYESSFTITAQDTDTWVISVQSSQEEQFNLLGSGDVRTGRTDTSSRCEVKFRNLRWEGTTTFSSDISGAVHDDNKPTNYNPDIWVGDLVIVGDPKDMSCMIADQHIDGGQFHPSAPAINLEFNSLEAAEAFRMVIMEHAEPSAAASIRSQQQWIDRGLTNAPVQYETEANGPLGPIEETETRSFEVHPLDVTFWEFTRKAAHLRREDGRETSRTDEDKCDVDVKRVDWSSAKILLPENPFTNQKRGTAVVLLGDDKHIVCESFDALYMKGHYLDLDFQDQDAARGFIAAMEQHSRDLPSVGAGAKDDPEGN